MKKIGNVQIYLPGQKDPFFYGVGGRVIVKDQETDIIVVSIAVAPKQGVIEVNFSDGHRLVYANAAFRYETAKLSVLLKSHLDFLVEKFQKWLERQNAWLEKKVGAFEAKREED